MNLADFKLMTLEARLDYLFEHSVKDAQKQLDAEANKWRAVGSCACYTPFGCSVHDKTPEHKVVGVCICGDPANVVIGSAPMCFACAYSEANVVDFTGDSTLDWNPDRVLQAATGGLESVVIVGLTKSGKEYFATSIADSAKVNWLLDRCKREVLDTESGD